MPKDYQKFKQIALRRARALPFWLNIITDGRCLDGDDMYQEIIQETELGKKFVEMEWRFQKYLEKEGMQDAD